MSDLDNGGAPDSPETGDTDTTSLYGAEPDGSTDDSTDDADTPELGAEDDLNSGATGALPEG